MKPEVDLELSISALRAYGVEPAIIKNMLANLDKLVNEKNDDANICEHCGEKDAEYRINPYIDEINGREVWEYICNPCYSMLLADI